MRLSLVRVLCYYSSISLAACQRRFCREVFLRLRARAKIINLPGSLFVCRPSIPNSSSRRAR
jgi:hypothetical protein